MLIFVAVVIFGAFPAAGFYGLYSLVRQHRPGAPALPLHWSDAVSVLAPFWVWILLTECTPFAEPKSLSNVVCELIPCGWFFSALLALRLTVAAWKQRLDRRLWGYATMIAVLLAAVLVALLVPCLPE
jgi:hypothetical protein